MTKYGYLVVEGPHDIEFVYRLLSPKGLGRVRLKSSLDPFWHNLIPNDYPPDDDLQKRVPVPLFLQNQTHSIAVHGAQGDTRIVQSVEETVAVIDVNQMAGIGVILDSDSQHSPKQRYDTLKINFAAKGLLLPDNAGEISQGSPHKGAFVLPDNQSQGTLEDILLECAQQVYPNLLASAQSHVNGFGSFTELNAGDGRDFSKPSGPAKAVVSSVASILRPGKSVQVSIQDNRWLRNGNLSIPRVKAVQEFLCALLEIL